MFRRRSRQEWSQAFFPWHRGTSAEGATERRERLRTELREQDGVKPLELFFDLLFVLVFTQCTALMSHDLTWTGLGRGLVVLAIVWWAWVSFAWLTSLVDPEEGAVRLIMFLVMVALLIMAFAIPEAFGDRGFWFAAAFGFVRAGHVALFWVASRDDPGLHRWVIGLAVASAISVALLVAAAAAPPGPKVVLWFAALIVDLGFPARWGVERWRIVPGHFAERHNLIIILALGESVIALGAGAEAELDSSVALVGALGLGLAAALWWIYFDVVALVTARRLQQAEPGRERNRLARDSYSYLHFPMVAGIVLCALAFEEAVPHGTAAFEVVTATALLGGVASYLLAHVVLRLRNRGSVNPERLVAALVALALIPVAVTVDAIWTLVIVDALLWGMIVFETIWVYDEQRFLLRHNQDVDIPTRRR